MGDQRQRRDCTLKLHDASQGNLPGVCVVCGDATNRVYPTLLYFWWKPAHWWKRIDLLLPLCGSDKDYWRRRSLNLRKACALGSVFFLTLVAVELLHLFIDPLAGPPDPISWSLDIGIWSACGIALFVSFCQLMVQMAGGIQIRHLDRDTVTLSRITPEFIEAYRVYCQEPSADFH